MRLPGTLPAGQIPTDIPANSKWLAGEGAGSWFAIQKVDDQCFRISRFSPKGALECDSDFSCSIAGFDPEEVFEMGYPSHCAKVTVIQSGRKYSFQAL